MAFLIITESIESTIESLKSEVDLHNQVYEQTKDSKYLIKAKTYQDKLNAAERYKLFFDKRSEWEKIKHLKTMKPSTYIQKCIAITKALKGVDFVRDKLEFRVRVMRNGKRVQIGTFDTPDDALEVLQMYM